MPSLSTMDLEPERCRRTDGRKWRCSRNVLPDEKYCERHLHRGRQRSRKHVEKTKTSASTNLAKMVSSNKSTITVNHHISTKENSNSATVPSPKTSRQVCSDDRIVSTTSSNRNIRKNGNLNVVNNSSTKSSYVSTYNVSNESFKLKRSRKNILSYSSAATVAPGFVVPPKSVLQSNVVGETSGKALTETNPQRCKRTDGRKWRCSSHVLPEQKYCDQHMHRGGRKLSAASDSVTIASSTSLAIPKKTNNGINLNMGSSDESSSTSGSSSSDATTITDENTNDTSRYIVRARTSDA